jgi:hypothetical protein
MPNIWHMVLPRFADRLKYWHMAVEPARDFAEKNLWPEIRVAA